MKYLYFFCLCIFNVNLFAQHPLGSVENDREYLATPVLSPALKFTPVTVPVFSLRKYCPTAGDQKTIASCVGWSTGYAAFSITYAVTNNLTDSAEINKHAKSALFLYNQIAQCDRGAFVGDALKFASAYGDCELHDFNPPACNVSPSTDVLAKAAGFKITESHRLFSKDATPETVISSVLNSLSAKKPVVISLGLRKSFFNVSANGLYNPADEEEFIGRHSMCVTGYNNVSKRLEILNSWGTGWGDNGFFTISYRDFVRYCNYAYQFSPADTTKAEVSHGTHLTGEFHYKKLNYNTNAASPIVSEITSQFRQTYYTFAKGNLRKGDYFRIIASGMQKDNYIYIFSLKPDGSSGMIFPLSVGETGEKVNDLPLIPADNVSVQIPPDDNHAIMTDLAGHDYLCILYTNKKIDNLKDIVAGLNQSTGDLLERLQASPLGSRLIPASEITYSQDSMAFTTNATHGDIAPIILSVNVTP
jgi:hypothetical protein